MANSVFAPLKVGQGTRARKAGRHLALAATNKRRLISPADPGI
jgi:hypothetical protein